MGEILTKEEMDRLLKYLATGEILSETEIDNILETLNTGELECENEENLDLNIVKRKASYFGLWMDFEKYLKNLITKENEIQDIDRKNLTELYRFMEEFGIAYNYHRPFLDMSPVDPFFDEEEEANKRYKFLWEVLKFEIRKQRKENPVMLKRYNKLLDLMFVSEMAELSNPREPKDPNELLSAEELLNLFSQPLVNIDLEECIKKYPPKRRF